MYAITYKGKPATQRYLHLLEKKTCSVINEDQYIAAPTKQRAVEMYLYYFGFTWKERPRGIECQRMIAERGTRA